MPLTLKAAIVATSYPALWRRWRRWCHHRSSRSPLDAVFFHVCCQWSRAPCRRHRPHTIRAVQYFESNLALLGPSASEATCVHALPLWPRTPPRPDYYATKRPQTTATRVATTHWFSAGRHIQFNATRDAGLDDLATVASVEKVYTWVV